MTRLRLKRVYDPPAEGDGARILVDRLWPRGLSKDKARIDLWLKEASPSHDLRKRFHGRPDGWDDFRRAYEKELETQAAQAAIAELRQLLRQGPVTLVYAARDEARNNAVALKEWLEG
jgi:uncharacterized protein YeaO (DUF488 family)